MAEHISDEDMQRDKVSANIDRMIRMLNEKYPTVDDSTAPGDPNDSLNPVNFTYTDNKHARRNTAFDVRSYMESYNRDLVKNIGQLTFDRKALGGVDPDSVYRELKNLALNMSKHVRKLAEAYAKLLSEEKTVTQSVKLPQTSESEPD